MAEALSQKFLSVAQLRERGIPFSKVHLWRLERAQKFPVRVHLSERCIAWDESEIVAWLAQRSAERRLAA